MPTCLNCNEASRVEPQIAKQIRASVSRRFVIWDNGRGLRRFPNSQRCYDLAIGAFLVH